MVRHVVRQSFQRCGHPALSVDPYIFSNEIIHHIGRLYEVKVVILIMRQKEALTSLPLDRRSGDSKRCQWR